MLLCALPGQKGACEVWLRRARIATLPALSQPPSTPQDHTPCFAVGHCIFMWIHPWWWPYAILQLKSGCPVEIHDATSLTPAQTWEAFHELPDWEPPIWFIFTSFPGFCHAPWELYFSSKNTGLITFFFFLLILWCLTTNVLPDYQWTFTLLHPDGLFQQVF